MKFDLVWRRHDDTSSWALATAAAKVPRREDVFFKHITSSSWSAREARHKGNPIMFKDFIVLGSAHGRADRDAHAPGLDFMERLNRYEHSVVLLVRFFKDHGAYKAADEQLHREIIEGGQGS